MQTFQIKLFTHNSGFPPNSVGMFSPGRMSRLCFLFPGRARGQFCAVQHFVCYWTAGHIALIPFYAA